MAFWSDFIPVWARCRRWRAGCLGGLLLDWGSETYVHARPGCCPFEDLGMGRAHCLCL